MVSVSLGGMGAPGRSAVCERAICDGFAELRPASGQGGLPRVRGTTHHVAGMSGALTVAPAGANQLTHPPAGGLGTASLTSKEPEALPFCALSYSMIGIISTVLAQLPFIRESLISIIG
jgi:hypothetical protein